MKERKVRVSTEHLFDQATPRTVLRELRHLLGEWYDPPMIRQVVRHFRSVHRLYEGKYRGYRSCNTDYHDLGHLYDILLAAIRLVDSCNLGMSAPLPETVVLQICLAALYHDAGFIQESWDTDGTGAKYTRIHIRRSQDFVRTQAARLKIDLNLVDGICVMIAATDMALEWEELQFASPAEELGCRILGAADILGQMADRTYLEKLLFLYYELREAAFSGYATAYDIIRNTASYYDAAQARLQTCLGAVDKHLPLHFKVRYGVDANLYQEAIDRQINYLQVIIDDPHKNFRTKLRRIDLNARELGYYA